MSDYEKHSGKIIKVSLENESIRDSMVRIMDRDDIKYRPEYPSYDFADSYENYFVAGDSLYQIIEDVSDDIEDSFTNLTNNPDGSISYVTQFYNGGNGLSEMLEEAITKLQKTE